MIGAFESMVRRHPQRTCFTCVDETGEARAYSYRETRMLSAALARHLRRRGVNPGDSVAVDLPNCAAYVFLVLAAAYGGFSLVALNNRLTGGEKLGRLMEIERKPGVNVALRVDEAAVGRLVDEAVALLAGEAEVGGGSRDPLDPPRFLGLSRFPRLPRGFALRGRAAPPHQLHGPRERACGRAALDARTRSGVVGPRVVAAARRDGTPRRGGERHPFRRACGACVRPRIPRARHVHVGHDGPFKSRVPHLGRTSALRRKCPTRCSTVAARACGRRCCRFTTSAASRWWCAAC